VPFRVVLDSDGLIKLAKAGALERVAEAWTGLVPRAVYVETVERGLGAAYPDAEAIRLVLPSAAVRRAARHPRAAALLRDKRGLGRGEQEALHLFFAARADAIVTDDARSWRCSPVRDCAILSRRWSWSAWSRDNTSSPLRRWTAWSGCGRSYGRRSTALLETT
jgi:predicted nucleic acid-binding protein